MMQENVKVADAAGGPVKSCTDEINAATAMGQDTNDQATAGGIGPTSTFRCVSVADEMVRESTSLTVITVIWGVEASAMAGHRWCGVVARLFRAALFWSFHLCNVDPNGRQFPLCYAYANLYSGGVGSCS